MKARLLLAVATERKVAGSSAIVERVGGEGGDNRAR